ncbi:MAG: hypothetical protein ACO3JL_20530 [Myxococcota bacterium]
MNRNGIQDAGEAPAVGVVVELLVRAIEGGAMREEQRRLRVKPQALDDHRGPPFDGAFGGGHR